MHVSALWRYPVKSLAGEPLEATGVGAVDPEMLRDIGRRFGGRLALNAEVRRGGSLAVGDPVALSSRTSKDIPGRRPI
jgi:hypothetical protein